MKKVMRVFCMALLCSILPISLLLGGFPVAAYTGNSAKTLTAGADIRVMSYNTLVDTDEANGGWSWGQPIGNRPEKAAAAIAYYQPDVIGLQENNYNWHVALRELLPTYDYVNADVPEVQKLEASASLGKKDWMCTTMIYNTETLELIDNELIGYSVNYWGCIQRMRYISMALFKVKKTGEMFVFTSTHFDAEKDTKGQKMREKQSTELANRLVYYQDTYGCPIISTGDYNSGYTDKPITTVRETAGMTSHENNRGGIDYILYSDGVTPKYFTLVSDADLSGASDHKPIFADLALDNGFSFPTTTTTKATTTTTTQSTTTTTKATTTTTLPSAFKPTKTTVAGGTTTKAPQTTAQATQAPVQSTVAPVVDTTTATEAPVDPTVTDTPVEPTDAPVVDTPTDVVDPVETTTTTTTVAVTDPVVEDEGADEQVEADIVKKGNDKLLYVGIGVAVVAIGAVITVVLLRKKK